MTAYINFIKDFPKRAIEIYSLGFEQAKANEREVTLLLSVAAVSLIVPYERLKLEHPSGDSHNYNLARNKLVRISNKEFLSSELWGLGQGWDCIEHLEGNEVLKPLDDWAKRDAFYPLNSSKTVGFVLGILRNAFAHGNIFLNSNDSSAHIENLIFLSQYRQEKSVKCSNCGEIIRHEKLLESTNRYKLLRISPDNFAGFLLKWVDFLQSLNLEEIDS